MKLTERLAIARERLGAPAIVVLMAATALACIGLVVCASVDYASEKASSYFTLQAGRLALGVPACLVAFWIRPRWLRAQAYGFYVACAAMLIAVLLFGRVVNGSRRWLEIGGFLRFQPSDLAKLAASLAIARICAIRARAESFGGVFCALAAAAVPAALILKEPDLGTAIVFIPSALAILAIAGAKRSHLLIVGALLVTGATLLLLYGLHGYQRDRIEMWLRQSSMTASEKQAQGYHLHRSMVAIGSGGLFGHGWAEGPQNQRDLLPERHTDFAFAVIAEEFGLAGALIVLFLEAALPAGLLILAFRVRESFSRLAIVGIAVQIGTQALVNMGVATGVFPTTGIALPLISYGGTSAIVTLVSIAIALNLAGHAEPVLAQEMFSPEEEETLLDRTLKPRPSLWNRSRRPATERPRR